MAKETASEVMLDILVDWGVEVIYGMPGDGINGIMEGLRRRRDKIKFVQVRHEESAAFMACAYAKFTGKLGVCLATSGPGGIHLLNGLYDAKMDGQPVLAITGHHYHDLIDTHAQQDIPLDRVFMDVAVYSTRIMSPPHVPAVTNLACRYALARKGVAHINFPVDLQEQEMDTGERSQRNKPGYPSHVFSQKAGIPSEEDIQQAAEILNAGKRVAILAGRGAFGAGEELEQIADILGAPIGKALLGKAVIPDDSSFTTGAVGLLGTTPSEEAFGNCDTFFMIGSSFPYIEFLPKPGQARGVQVDIDPIRIGLRYNMECGLVGDAKKTLQALIPLLRRKKDRSFLEKAQKGMKDWWKLMEKRGTNPDLPMKPQVVAWELGKLLKDDAIVASDSGTVATWWARQIKARSGQMYSLSGTLASMANGLPYAIAAQVAFPKRQVIAFVGDGGFSMLMAEFATAVKYKLPIKVVIIKNNSLGQIKWEQMALLGNPEYGCDLHPIDFVAFAKACGGEGYYIDDPKRCRETLREALNRPGPVIVEAMVDPHTPPMPGKIKAGQAMHFAESLARGEPHRVDIVRSIVKDRVRELI